MFHKKEDLEGTTEKENYLKILKSVNVLLTCSKKYYSVIYNSVCKL